MEEVHEVRYEGSVWSFHALSRVPSSLGCAHQSGRSLNPIMQGFWWKLQNEAGLCPSLPIGD